MANQTDGPIASGSQTSSFQTVTDPGKLAAEIKAACIDAALAAYEDAAANGLCAEGAWECAVDAMRRLKVEDLLQDSSDQTSNR